MLALLSYPLRSVGCSPSLSGLVPSIFRHTVLFFALRISLMDQKLALHNRQMSSFHTAVRASPSSSTGRCTEKNDFGERNRGGWRRNSNTDKIDALGRLLVRVLRHTASELRLNMRSDGYVKVCEVMKLNMKTNANIPLSSHTIADVKEAVQKDNKQRFSLLEENGELLIRANQGHSVKIVETERLLKSILSPEEAPLCVHGTYGKNLPSILQCGLKRFTRLHIHFSSGLPSDGEVISGMRRGVNVLIYLNVRAALEGGMKLYISDNKVILTEGFDGVVPVKYFDRIESWPRRDLIPIGDTS